MIDILAAAAVALIVATTRNSVAADAEPTNAPPRNSLAQFKIITERNIFNANRRPRSARRSAPEEKPLKTEAFSLIGTLLHEGGTFAFFDGTEPQYKKVLKPGESIAGYKIVEVSVNLAKLEAGESKIELPLGMQMSKRGEENWKLVVGTASSSASSGSSRRDRDSGRTSDASSEEKSTGETGSDSAADEVLKKLMQKREQEQNK